MPRVTINAWQRGQVFLVPMSKRFAKWWQPVHCHASVGFGILWPDATQAGKKVPHEVQDVFQSEMMLSQV